MNSKFTHFLKRVRDSRESEIDCSACLAQIHTYVDLELSGGNAPGQMPLVRQHLDQCGICHDEYQILRELARLEAGDSLPSQEELRERLKGKQ